ncbi:hypothetical protein F441_10858 [Phytophthora nicotianae CJ01A1]|uniref:Reverse transcriptase/retrotransposon-derived protein RNase H-like domain-containing protein n=1 Tax=Phytophthora nicotianae CJ01A1 TaxID=1317063 RepID=W2WVI4_PHYNI|nr:hypothetical protein F441_10858 [Phytophthora nicotianae CJ01A1]
MLPDHSKPFHVVCDASDFAIGCALINNAVHASTGLIPFFINFGRHPRVPALLGLEHSSAVSPAPATDDAATTASSDRATSSRAAVTPAYVDSRADAHDTAAPLLHAVTTRHGAKTATQGVRTRAATRAALSADDAAQGQTPRSSAATRATPPDIAAWTSRTLIAPRQRRAVTRTCRAQPVLLRRFPRTSTHFRCHSLVTLWLSTTS